MAASGIWARSTYGAQSSGDEPQYLLTALSLARDGDLDVSDEIAGQEYTGFHEIDLDPQTTPVDDRGRMFSPHDPLLPVILAPVVAPLGWHWARAELALAAGVGAALTWWVAHRRFGVSPLAAAVAAVGFGVGAPLVAYGTQVYPEIVAATLTVAGVGLVTARRLDALHVGGMVVVLTALPWLSVKYVPVAVAVAVVAAVKLARTDRRLLWIGSGALAAAGVIYLVIHHRVYGGWTVYSAGDHFLDTGEFSVIGESPDFPARTRRLVGLLVDRGWGLVPWAPIWLLGPASVAAVVRGRVEGGLALTLPLAAGWATATWAALTMHGFWFTGRQVVVVAPLVAIAVARLIDGRFGWMLATAAAGLVGAVNWLWLAWESSTGRRTVIVDFTETDAVFYRMVAPLFPDGTRDSSGSDLGLVLWAVLIGIVVVVVVRDVVKWSDVRRGTDRGADRARRSRAVG